MPGAEDGPSPGPGAGDAPRQAAPLPFVDGPLAPTLERRRVTIEPGGRVDYDPEQWRGALVVVAAGEVALECTAGGRTRFRSGDILWLAGLPLVALHNEQAEPTTIVAIGRRPPDS